MSGEPFIKLDQFLKVMGVAPTGGQAKIMVQYGAVQVNGEVETRRGRKLRPGDQVTVDDRTFVVELDEPEPAVNPTMDKKRPSDTVDFGRHAQDYATHRPGPPASFYERLDTFIPLQGSRALDLATGPGTLALELAVRGSKVVGIDKSAEQVAAAEQAAVHLPQGRQLAAHFRVATAEATGLDPASFDLATAGQSWHWFDSEATLAELQRLLRPGGILTIVHHSYLAEHSPVAGDTEALILEYNPTWTMAGSTGVFAGQIDEVIRGGFKLVEAFCYEYDQSFTHAAWRGRMRTCNGVGSGSLTPAEVEDFDGALGRLLRERYPDPLVVPHRIWSVVAQKPA